MKCFKKLVSVVAAAALLAVIPNVSALQADAATPTTHYIRYDIDKNQWRVQTGEWNNEYEGRETYYLNNGSEKVNDGDYVVILENEEQAMGSTPLSIDARIGNLTVSRTSVVISAKSIDECYVLGDSYAAITGNVTNAYVYDEAHCTFHSNVGNLRLISSQDNEVRTTVSVGGTVGYCSVANPGGVIEEYSNFAAGKFDYDKVSGVITDEQYYTKKGAPVAAPAPAANGANATPAASNTNSNDYDDVPKTGENNLVVWLLGLSALSFAGCLAFRKSANR